MQEKNKIIIETNVKWHKKREENEKEIRKGVRVIVEGSE